MQVLTDRQQEVLSFLEHHIDTKGYAPSRREIADHIGVTSSNAAHQILQILDRKGYISKGGHNVARSITVKHSYTEDD